MKTLKQLLRQPLKSLSGLLLMTVAASILCVCVGQAFAAQATKEALNKEFSTIAVPRVYEKEDDYLYEDQIVYMDPDQIIMDDEMLAWLEQAQQEHPKILLGVSQHGILSACIPEMTPLNITSVKYENWIDTSIDYNFSGDGFAYSLYTEFRAHPNGMPQSCAMFVITLENMEPLYKDTETIWSDPDPLDRNDFATPQQYWEYYSKIEKFDVAYCEICELSGTITQVIYLPDGFRDIVGMTARLKLKVESKEDIEAMNLELGQQYIVYGMDLFDEHWRLDATLRKNGVYPSIEPFNPSLLTVYTEEQKKQNYPIVATYCGIKLNEYRYKCINSVSMTLDDLSSFKRFEKIYDEDGFIIDVIERTNIEFTNISGETVTLSKEEIQEIYKIPTIARLEVSVEDFLSSEEGAAWQEALERDEINNHAFAVMCVDRLDYLETFAFGSSRFIDGRGFTPEEQENGAKVCIVNAKVAAENGLEVGDTITLSMYATDYGLPYQKNRSENKGALNPVASFYFDTTPFVQTAEYTIVGTWQGDRVWADLTEEPYSFSANTVFVPKSSVQATMETCDSVLFNTIVIENGQMEAFMNLAMDAGFGNCFRLTDMGYSEMAANFHNYEELAKQVLVIGAVIYGVLLFLFLLLYPGMQKNNAHTMQSLGSGYGRRLGYVVAMSMMILIPSSVFGGLLGVLLWDRMVVVLQETAMSAVALELDMAVLARIAGAQFVLALALSAAVALFVAAPRGMSARR